MRARPLRPAWTDAVVMHSSQAALNRSNAATQERKKAGLDDLAGATEQMFLVAGVPDEKKGERLVVLHRLSPEKLAQCDLPNLWKPRADQFFHVEALPYLGTGKLDLRQAREIAGTFSTSP